MNQVIWWHNGAAGKNCPHGADFNALVANQNWITGVGSSIMGEGWLIRELLMVELMLLRDKSLRKFEKILKIFGL